MCASNDDPDIILFPSGENDTESILLPTSISLMNAGFGFSPMYSTHVILFMFLAVLMIIYLMSINIAEIAHPVRHIYPMRRVQ